MADVLTKEQRHKNMQQIRSKDTKPEIILRKALWEKGYRYRKNYHLLPGKPDIVITKYKICVFVDSEFFHGKDFESGYKSTKYSSLKDQLKHSNNSEFWIKKIAGNMERDKKNDIELQNMGWTIIRFWTKEVLGNVDDCVKAIEDLVIDQKMLQRERENRDSVRYIP